MGGPQELPDTTGFEANLFVGLHPAQRPSLLHRWWPSVCVWLLLVRVGGRGGACWTLHLREASPCSACLAALCSVSPSPSSDAVPQQEGERRAEGWSGEAVVAGGTRLR